MPLRDHGTPARYNHGPDENDAAGKGCRCDDCTDAIRRYRTHQRARGPQYVSPVRARRAMRQLRSFGWTLEMVGDATGLSARNILRGRRCTRDVERAILDLRDRVAAERSRRLPFEPVERVAALRVLDHWTGGPGQGKTAAVARHLGVDDRQVYRWRDYGITPDQADGFAVRLGFHPLELWPDFHDELTAA